MAVSKKTGTGVKKIIALGDVHIRNYKRHEEYASKMRTFFSLVEETCKPYSADEVRIVVAGDVLHNKTDISPEAYLMAANFLKKLGTFAKTIVIAGNHDISKNENHLDPMSAIFNITEMDNIVFLDKELSYESGCYVDDNIVWSLYSSFDGFKRPNIDKFRIEYPKKTFVGLFHGTLCGSVTDAGYQNTRGLSASYFDNLDFAILGHIHKRQCIKYEGIPLVYCGSLIQQDMGENLGKHGFLLWDVDDATYEEIDLPQDEYGYYNFVINSPKDIEDDKEELINL